MSATDTGLSLDVSQLKLLKSLKQTKPEEKEDSATPALDMKRMIEQLFEAKYTKPVGGADAGFAPASETAANVDHPGFHRQLAAMPQPGSSRDG